MEFWSPVDYKHLNEALIKNIFTPLSYYLRDMLYPHFIKYFVLDEKEFDDFFDLFEYILVLNNIHLVGGSWVPAGRFNIWRYNFRRKSNLLIDFLNDAVIKKDEWLPLKSGMFDGKYETFCSTKTVLDVYMQNHRYI